MFSKEIRNFRTQSKHHNPRFLHEMVMETNFPSRMSEFTTREIMEAYRKSSLVNESL